MTGERVYANERATHFRHARQERVSEYTNIPPNARKEVDQNEPFQDSERMIGNQDHGPCAGNAGQIAGPDLVMHIQLVEDCPRELRGRNRSSALLVDPVEFRRSKKTLQRAGDRKLLDRTAKNRRFSGARNSIHTQLLSYANWVTK